MFFWHVDLVISYLNGAILDFCSIEELIGAKRQLLNDAKSLQSVDNMRRAHRNDVTVSRDLSKSSTTFSLYSPTSMKT